MQPLCPASTACRGEDTSKNTEETDIADASAEPGCNASGPHSRDGDPVPRRLACPRQPLPAAAALVILTAALGAGLSISSGDDGLQRGVLALAVAVGLLAALLWSALRQPLPRGPAGASRLAGSVATSSQAAAREIEQMAGIGTWTLQVRRREFHWSAGALALLGLPATGPSRGVDEVCGFIHADDRRPWREAHRRALSTGGDLHIEFRWIRPDGSEIQVQSQGRIHRNASGAVTDLSGIVQDITTARTMQRALEASEARFRELTHLSSDWIWETDVQHRLTSLSDAHGPLADEWARAVTGRRRWENPAYDLPVTDWSAYRRACAQRESFENLEFSRIDPRGNVHHLSISGHPVIDARGQFAGYRGIGRDITREKRQRTLLELEGDIAAILGSRTEPADVIQSVLALVCDRFGWIGGIHLECQGRTACRRGQYGRSEGFAEMIAILPDEIPVSEGSIEDQGCRGSSPSWNTDPGSYSAFRIRYRARALGVQATFVAPLRNEFGHPTGMLLFLSPVATRSEDFFDQVAQVLSRTLSLFLQRKAAERKLTRASLRDALTGLSNRAHMLQEIDAHLRRETPIALLYVDLDRYKLINDTLGHSAGDKALGEIARRLSETAGAKHAVGRMGGDEFIVLVSPCGTRDEIETLARRILDAIEQPLVLSGRAFFLSASIGIAFAPEDATDAQSLIRCADAAMYEVKSVGRSDVRFFTGGISDARAVQLQLLAELPQAIERGEIELYYQPIIDIGERAATGYEALLRWRHPTRGLLLPDQFLPVAEQHRSIREIGLWSIRRALEDRIRLGIDTWPDVTVSVNVSALQFTEEDFLPALNDAMLELHFPPRLLRLELTESAFIENPQRAAVLIDDLRRLGVQVIVDNFGTGYASLSYLKNLPVDGLKIDRTFVQNLPDDRGNAAIVQAITAMAGKLGMQAVAEGVETAAELHELRLLSCEQVQGTLISQPLPLPELAGFLETMPTLRRMHRVQDDDVAHARTI